MNCCCNQAELIHDEVEAHTGFGCKVCGGAWLPKPYVKSIETMKEFDYSLFQEARVKYSAQPSHLNCPHGCGLLEKHIEHEVPFEFCRQCSGVWFEKGELKAFLNHYRDGYDVRNDGLDFKLTGIELFTMFFR